MPRPGMAVGAMAVVGQVHRCFGAGKRVDWSVVCCWRKGETMEVCVGDVGGGVGVMGRK